MKRLLALVALMTAAVVGVVLWRRAQAPASLPVSTWGDPVPPVPPTPAPVMGDEAAVTPPKAPTPERPATAEKAPRKAAAKKAPAAAKSAKSPADTKAAGAKPAPRTRKANPDAAS
jgi:general secretion pathway protein B